MNSLFDDAKKLILNEISLYVGKNVWKIVKEGK